MDGWARLADAPWQRFEGIFNVQVSLTTKSSQNNNSVIQFVNGRLSESIPLSLLRKHFIYS